MGLGRVRRAALAAAVLVTAGGCGGGVGLVAQDGAPDAPALARTDASPPARPSPASTPAALRPFRHLTCAGSGGQSVIAKVSFDGATARTPEEALAQQLTAMASREVPWTELPGLTWERRAVKRPAASAAFVGSRPDGTEHASIGLISSGPFGVWVANEWTVCARTPAPDDEPAGVAAARPVFDGSIDCAAGTRPIEVVLDYDPDDLDRPGTAPAPDEGLAEFLAWAGGTDGRFRQLPDLRWTRHEPAKFNDPHLSDKVRARILSRGAVYVGTASDGTEAAALYFQKAGRQGFWSHWGGQHCEPASAEAPPA